MNPLEKVSLSVPRILGVLLLNVTYQADIEDEALELGDNQIEEDFDLESDDDDDDIAEGFEDEELEDIKDGKHV